MADKVQLRAGNKEGMPTLTDREPAYVRDEKALYIGTPEGNVKLCSAETEGKVAELEKRVVAAQADLATDADLAKVISAYNSLIAAMKTGGVMST